MGKDNTDEGMVRGEAVINSQMQIEPKIEFLDEQGCCLYNYYGQKSIFYLV